MKNKSTTIETFYKFSPIKIGTDIYYKTTKVFNNKDFQVLVNKKYPQFVVRIRTNQFFSSIFQLFLKKDTPVPHKDCYLIYKGSDSTLYFCENRNGKYIIGEDKLGNFTKENFKGYPIHYDFHSTEIENKDLIVSILKEHLKFVKTDRTNLHGDFTIYNILVDANGKVSFIDSKKRKGESLLSDHFYFYTYFLIRTKRHNRFNRKKQKFLENELVEIFKEVFENEKEGLFAEIEKLTENDIITTKHKTNFYFYKEKFKSLLQNN